MTDDLTAGEITAALARGTWPNEPVLMRELPTGERLAVFDDGEIVRFEMRSAEYVSRTSVSPPDVWARVPVTRVAWNDAPDAALRFVLWSLRQTIRDVYAEHGYPTDHLPPNDSA